MPSHTQLNIQGISSKYTPMNLVLQLIKPKTEFKTVLTEFPSILSLTNLTIQLNTMSLTIIKTNGLPVHSRACPLSPEKLKIAYQEFKHMLQLGIIQHSYSNRFSPPHMVPKKTPGNWRETL